MHLLDSFLHWGWPLCGIPLCMHDLGQVQCMVNFALEDMKNSVQRSSNDELGCLSLNIDPFEDLHSEYMQTKYFKENFGLVVTITQLERQ